MQNVPNQGRPSNIESEYILYIVDYQCILMFIIKNYFKY